MISLTRRLCGYPTNQNTRNCAWASFTVSIMTMEGRDHVAPVQELCEACACCMAKSREKKKREKSILYAQYMRTYVHVCASNITCTLLEKSNIRTLRAHRLCPFITHTTHTLLFPHTGDTSKFHKFPFIPNSNNQQNEQAVCRKT